VLAAHSARLQLLPQSALPQVPVHRAGVLARGATGSAGRMTRRLRVPDDLARLIRGLHPDLKRQLRDALSDVVADSGTSTPWRRTSDAPFRLGALPNGGSGVCGAGLLSFHTAEESVEAVRAVVLSADVGATGPAACFEAALRRLRRPCAYARRRGFAAHGDRGRCGRRFGSAVPDIATGLPAPAAGVRRARDRHSARARPVSRSVSLLEADAGRSPRRGARTRHASAPSSALLRGVKRFTEDVFE